MTHAPFSIPRRTLLGGLVATLLLPSRAVRAQARTAVALDAVAGTIALRPGQPPTPIWQLTGGPDAGPLRFKRGAVVDLTLTNRLPVPVVLVWSGLNGNPMAEPWTERPALAPNASATYPITVRHAGTMLVDIATAGGADKRATIARPTVVTEAEPPSFDRDEVLLFQDWRQRPDGSAVAPGTCPGDAATIFTVNGQATFDLLATPNQRLRLRLINFSQHTVIAFKISDQETRVLAIDGQPSEPFLARDGVVVLTPGARVDAVIDVVKPAGSFSAIMLLDGREPRLVGRLLVANEPAARPAPLSAPAALPSNGLPAQIDLKSALRIDLPLGTADWLAPTALGSTTPPAFKVKRGRTVVLALTNRAATPVTIHLHGHHVRLLDRLDDGWKPFWLDTLTVAAGQTQRVAFAAEFAGLYPISTTATDWGSPKRVRSYLVE